MKGLIIALLVSFVASAAPAGPGVTLQGQLLRPDGSPVRTSVEFRLQVRTPGAENCLLYEETQTKDLSLTDGVFVLTLNDGSATTQVNTFGFERIFQNNKPFNFSAGSCAGGPLYSPNALDDRRLEIAFRDGTFSGWEALPSQKIGYTPMAIESTSVGGYGAGNLLRVDGAAIQALTAVQHNTLLDLINGTGSQYLRSTSVLDGSHLQNGSVTDTAIVSLSWPKIAGVPASLSQIGGLSCPDGQILKVSSGVWTCATESSGGVTSVSTASPLISTGGVAPQISIPKADGSHDGYLSQSDWTNFSSKQPALGFTPVDRAGDSMTGSLQVAGSVKIGTDVSGCDGTKGGTLRYSSGNVEYCNGMAWTPFGVSGGGTVLSGDVTGMTTATSVDKIKGATVSAIAPTGGKVMKYVGGTSAWTPSDLQFSDIKNGLGGSAFNVGACTAGQTVAWSSLTDTLTCVNISITESNISGTIATSKITGLGALAILNVGTGLSASAGNLNVDFTADTTKVAKSGDTMSGSLTLTSGAVVVPVNGLVVGSNQLVASGGNVGIGSSSPTEKLDVSGNVRVLGTVKGSQLCISADCRGAWPSVNSDVVPGAVGSVLTSNGSSWTSSPPNFGTTAGTIAQGNDSRFPNALCGSGNKMRWNGSNWVCEPTLDVTRVDAPNTGDLSANWYAFPALAGGKLYQYCTYLMIINPGTSGSLTIKFKFTGEAGEVMGNMVSAVSVTTAGNWNSLCAPFYVSSGTVYYQPVFSGTGTVTYSMRIRITPMD